MRQDENEKFPFPRIHPGKRDELFLCPSQLNEAAAIKGRRKLYAPLHVSQAGRTRGEL